MRASCRQSLSGLAACLFAAGALHGGEALALTPAGTLYLVAPVSVRTPTGIIGFELGQTVRLVRADAKAGRWLVTDGKYQVEVTPAQVTTDAKVAAVLRQQEEASRRAAQAAQEARLLAQKRHEAALRKIEFDRDVEIAKHVLPPTPMKQSTIYDRPYDLRGDPYHATHDIVPRWQGPHQKPGTLRFDSYGLGYY